MNKISLEDLLKNKGNLHCGMIAQSILVNKLEVCGYVNVCLDESMYFFDAKSDLFLNGVINKDPIGQIVLSNYIHQVITYTNGKALLIQAIVFPIFKSISVSKKESSYNIEDLFIPSLEGNRYFKEIKSRKGNGVVVQESKLRKALFPSNIQEVEGKAIMTAQPGHIQCFDKHGVMKGVGENILVVCRYLHEGTGKMCYVQYNLDEVFVDDVH